MFSRGWASDLYFTLESECSVNWHAYSQETVFHLTMFFPLPPIRAQPCGRCSLAEMGAVHTKLASNESRRYVASYSQSKHFSTTQKTHGCVSQVQCRNFYRHFNLQIFPRPQVQKCFVRFLQDLLPFCQHRTNPVLEPNLFEVITYSSGG